MLTSITANGATSTLKFAAAGGDLIILGAGCVPCGFNAGAGPIEFSSGDAERVWFTGPNIASVTLSFNRHVSITTSSFEVASAGDVALDLGANKLSATSAGASGLRVYSPNAANPITTTNTDADALSFSAASGQLLQIDVASGSLHGNVTATATSVQVNNALFANSGTLAINGNSGTGLTLSGDGSIGAGVAPATISTGDGQTLVFGGSHNLTSNVTMTTGTFNLTGSADAATNKVIVQAAGAAGLTVTGAGSLISTNAAADAIKFQTTASQSLTWDSDVDIQGNLQIATGGSSFIINANVSPTGSLQLIPVGDTLTIAGAGGALDSGTGLIEILGPSGSSLVVSDDTDVDFMDSVRIVVDTLTNNASMRILAAEADLQVSTININGLVEVSNPSGPAKLKLDPRAPINMNTSSPATLRAIGDAGQTSIEFNPTDAADVTIAGDDLVIESSGTVVFNGGTKAAAISVDVKQITSSISVMGTLDSFSLKTTTGNLTFGTAVSTNGGATNDGGTIDLRALGGTLAVNGNLDSSSGGASFNAGNLTLVGSSITAGTVTATGGGGDGSLSFTLDDGTLNLGSATGLSIAIEGATTLVARDSGTATYTATAGDLVVQNIAGITFDSLTPGTGTTFNFNTGAATGLQVISLTGAVTVGTNTLVNGSEDITVTACTFINPNGFVPGGSGTLTLNVSPLCNLANGCGTIANSNASVVLTKSLLVNTNGLDLAIIASGDILAQGSMTIDLSGTSGRGGNLHIFAGVDFEPATLGEVRDTTTLFEVFGPSATGGDVELGSVSINTGTRAAGADAGNVDVVALAGGVSTGSVSLGKLDLRSVSGNGGDVTVIGEGGIWVLGSIQTSGATTSGDVGLFAAPPIQSGITVIRNGLVVGGFEPGCPVCGSNSVVLVTGKIDTSSSAGRGGNAVMEADRLVQVGKSITTTGLGQSGSGSVEVSTDEGGFSVGKSLNTGGVSISSSSSTADAGDAGDVIIVGTGFVHVGGNLLARGGSTKGTGRGGNAGDLLLLGNPVAGPDDYATGSFRVGGRIDVRGGNSVGGDGGNGGNLTLQIGRFAVMTSSGGVSVNASGGAGTNAGADGQISITTFAVQELPVNFDLTATTMTEVAFPGGLFAVGTPGVINGARGSIVSGQDEASAANAGRLVNGVHSFGNVQIEVVGGGTDIDVNGTPVTINPDNGAGVRTRVTSGQALALFQVSRGDDQEIGLNAAGQVTDSSPLGGQSVIVVQSTDFDPIAEFSSFKLATVGANLVTINVDGPGALLNLKSAKNVFIAGTLDFTTAGVNATIDLGKQMLSVGTTGTLTASDFGRITINGSKLTNDGAVLANQFSVDNNDLPVVFVMAPGGKLGAPIGQTGTTSFNASAVTLTGGELQETRLMLTMKGKPGDLNIETSFGTNAEIGGIQAFRQVSVTSTAGSDLKIGNNAPVLANVRVTLTGEQNLIIGAGSTIQAGMLADGAPATGVLSSQQIASRGSLSLTASGSIEIQSGTGADQTVLNSVGGDTTIVAGSGTLTFGDNAVVRVDGGNMFLHGNDGLTGGIDNTFYARAVGSSGGGLELAAGALATNQILLAFTFPAGTAPASSQLGTNVTINNGAGTSGVVRALTGATGQNNLSTSGLHAATLNLTGGVMVFESNGASVELDGGTFTTEALKPISYTSGSTHDGAATCPADEDFIVDTGDCEDEETTLAEM